MSNLRAALHVDLGMRDDLAVRISTVVWLLSLVLLVGASWRVPPTWARAWSFTVLAYLLFCPHVSATEDLALCCVLATLGFDRRRDPLAFAFVLLVLGGLCVSAAIGPLHDRRPSVLFFVKLGVLGVGVLPRRDDQGVEGVGASVAMTSAAG
jgi:hypothetical protein